MNMNKQEAIKCEACRIGVEELKLETFIHIESGGRGFNSDGKLIIQFEPHLYKRHAKHEYNTYLKLSQKNTDSLTNKDKEYIDKFQYVLNNKVSNQTLEYKAFNIAFGFNKEAAMLSTSIGLGQVLGMNYARLGYKDVGSMWDDAKRGEDRQIFQMAEFIRTDNRLLQALKEGDWHTVASRYNGAGYKALAKRLGITPYDERMRNYYNKRKSENK